MNTLVIYDSQYGNTEQIARAIADTCRAFGPAEALRVDYTPDISWKGIDLLVVGCPTQQFRPTPAMRAFWERLTRDDLGHVSVACFDTRVHLPWPLNSTAAHGIARHLRSRGAHLLVSPEGFFVQGTEGPLAEGEIERAARWALTVQRAFATAHLQPASR